MARAYALLAVLLCAPYAEAQRAKAVIPAEAAVLVPTASASPVLTLTSPLASVAASAIAEPQALGAHYDGGTVPKSPSASVVSGGVGPGAAPLARSAAFEPTAKPAVPAAPSARRGWLSRFPVFRGEIGWRRAWQLADSSSKENTVNNWSLKDSSQRRRESEMHRHNIGYLFGFRERTFHDQDLLNRAVERERVRVERGEKVRAAYKLPSFSSENAPTAILGQELGSGGQGAAYRRADAPGHAVKVFRDTPPAQLQEMAAILDAVAAKGYPVERVKIVRIAEGYGLDMRHFSYENGWSNLATYVRARPASETAALVRRAEDTLHAVGAESKRVLGVSAADWKAGFDGAVSDDHLENFVVNRRTGELVCFDCLVRW